MNIDNAANEIRSEYIEPMTKSVNRFSGFIAIVIVILGLLLFFIGRDFLTSIEHKVELVQAILVCSTALMGLSGLMIIETKKINVEGLNSEDGRERVRAINYITSLARGNLFLRWSMLWAIFSIIISGLNLMIDNSALLAGSIMAFLAQIYLFIWGLLFSEFLPS